MMPRAAYLALGTLFAAGSANALFRVTSANGKAGSKTRADMQPDVVARTLSQVETEWSDEASEFLECNDTAAEDETKDCGPTEFKKSCPKVVSAIVQASNGDKTEVVDYMKTVCGQDALGGWQKEECKTLSASLTGFMTMDSYDNRVNFDGSKFCQKFWAVLAKEEADHTRVEREERKRLRDEAENARKAEAQKLLDAQNAKQLEEQKKADEEEALRRAEEKKIDEQKEKVKAQVMALKANNTVNATKSHKEKTAAPAKAATPQDLRHHTVAWSLSANSSAKAPAKK